MMGGANYGLARKYGIGRCCLSFLAIAFLTAAVAAAQETVAPGAGWLECAPGAEGSDAVKNGDPVERCCAARRLWQEIAANGGCGGGGSDSEQNKLDCNMAEALCEECKADARMTAWSTMGNNSAWAASAGSPKVGSVSSATPATTAAEGVTLSSLDRNALEMRCALTQVEPECDEAFLDIGLGIVLLTGVLLLSLSALSIVIFDRLLLPRFVAWLQYQPASASKGDCIGSMPTPTSVTAPWPPPVAKATIDPPIGEPPVWDGTAGDTLRKARGLEDAQIDALRFAATADDSVTITDTFTDDQNPPRPPSNVTESIHSSPPAHMQSLRPSLTATPTLEAATPLHWPPRLAEVWANRSAFLVIASFAALMRLIHAIASSLLGVSGVVNALFVEPFTCLVPLLWIMFTSQPPASPESGIPSKIAYSCPCQRLPRFSAFALATVIFEMYSTLIAARAVAGARCSMPPWRVILPYCFGVLVATLRAYSAFLALRLQDDLVSACRRVVPVLYQTADGKDTGSPVAACDIECKLSDDAGADAVIGYAVQDWALETVLAQIGTPTRRLPRPGRTSDGWWEPAHQPTKPKAEEKTGRSSIEEKLAPKDHFRCCCPVRLLMQGAQKTEIQENLSDADNRPGLCLRCRRRLTWRFLLKLGILAAVLSATASALIIRFVGDALNDEKKLPSSCSTAQNATATCTQFEIVGQHLWDYTVGDSHMEIADTREDCCRGCDNLPDCQAWMFESMARRCRWIGFLEDPCKSNPGDLRCRCLTHFGTAFGFKPTSQIIWVQREV